MTGVPINGDIWTGDSARREGDLKTRGRRSCEDARRDGRDQRPLGLHAKERLRLPEAGTGKEETVPSLPPSEGACYCRLTPGFQN